MIRQGAISLMVALVPLSLAAEDGVVTMHERILAAPTIWCPANAGVPVVFSVDGPDVHIENLRENRYNSVIVRRGNADRQLVDVGPISSVEIRRRRGTQIETLDTRNFSAIDQRDADLIPLGRLSFEMNVCQSLWSTSYVSGFWKIVAEDGSVARSGKTTTPPLYPGLNQLFYSGSFPKAFKIDDQFYFVNERQEYIRTTEAFASPAEE